MNPRNRKPSNTIRFKANMLLAAIVLAPQLQAAENTDNPKQNELSLEEVVVTAQKQSQNVQDTPVSVNAISGDTFAEMAGFSLDEVDKLTAGVDISGDSFNIDFKIRGTGTNLDAGTSPRVTVYKDGAFVNQQRALFLSQYDLERFELLRGPQGTLYGKASPAGALVIHTKDPSMNSYDGYIKQSVFSRDGFNSQFGASIPLVTDKLALRVAGTFDKNSNSDITNKPSGDEQINRTTGGRLTAKWYASDDLDARVSYNYTNSKSDYYQVSDQGGQDPKKRLATADYESPTLEIRDEHVVAEMNYALGDTMTITGVTMYQELTTERRFDSDATTDQPTLLDPRIISTTQDVDSDIGKVWNSELRFHNTVGDHWDWISGLYYSRSIAVTDVTAETAFSRPLAPVGALSFPGGVFSANDTLTLRAKNQSEDFGVFHHSGIEINERDKVTVGLRYSDVSTNARNQFAGVTTIDVPAPFQPFFGTTPRSGEAIPLAFEKREYSEFTGTLKFQRTFNDDNMAYISWDRGWRNASATVDTEGFVPPEYILHDDESSNNFELGFKGDFWDRRARYNVAMYQQNYQNFQVQADGILVDSNGNGALDPADRKFNAIVNADKVLIRGAEVEMTALVMSSWTAFVSLSYNDTKFDKYDNAPCNSGDPLSPGQSFNTCDFTGQRISDTPNWSAVMSSDYSIGFDNFGAELYFRILAKYEGAREYRSTGLKVNGDTVVDIFTGFRDYQGRWDVNLWVKNLGDKAAVRGVDVNTVGKTTYEVNNPLTVGLSGTYNWGVE